MRLIDTNAIIDSLKDQGVNICPADIGAVLFKCLGLTNAQSLYLTTKKYDTTHNASSKASQFYSQPKIKNLVPILAPILREYIISYLLENPDTFTSVNNIDQKATINSIPIQETNSTTEPFSTEEIVRYATNALRYETGKVNTDPKIISEMLKILDNVNALPKQKNSEDIHQIIVESKYTSICPYCNREH